MIIVGTDIKTQLQNRLFCWGVPTIIQNVFRLNVTSDTRFVIIALNKNFRVAHKMMS